MNRLEAFISQLENKTRRNEITWETQGSSKYDAIIHNSRYCSRLFGAKLEKGRTILAIERKVPRLDPDLEEYFDHLELEVILVSDSMTEKIISEADVSKAYLMDLIEAISGKVFESESFIDEFLS